MIIVRPLPAGSILVAVIVAALLASSCIAAPGDRRSPVTAVETESATTVSVGTKGFEHVWSTELPGQQPQQILADQTNEPYVYVASKSGGLAVLAKEDGGVVAGVPTSSMAGLDLMYLAQQGNLLVGSLGDFFSRSAPAGLATFDVSDPTDPKVLGLWTSADVAEGAPAVVLSESGATAFLAMMSHGIAAIDVSDPGQPQLMSVYEPDPDFPRVDPNDVARPNARGLELDGELLYVAHDAGGLRVLDVSEPAAIREIGRHINPDGEKQQAYNDVLIEGSYLYASLDYCGLEVIDTTKPSQPTQIAWLDLWDCNSATNLWVNSPGHTNQLHLDRDLDMLWVSAGGSELVAVLVADPAHPVVAASYGSPNTKRGTYGLGADDNLVYLSYIETFVPFQGRWSGVTAVRSTANR